MMDNILNTIIVSLFFIAGPIVILVWFCVSLVKFLKRDRNDAVQCKFRLKMLIVSAAVTGTLVAVIGGFIILLMLAMTHM